MAIDINRAEATRILDASRASCLESPSSNCLIKDEIDLVMSGKNCLTYRYILLTALVAKSVDERVDVLSLQAGDASAGAYDARSLASKVIYPFQKSMLGNALDGSNNDPLVNKPGRFPRLRPDNPTAGGDPRRALHALCDALPRVETSGEARRCVDYIVSRLLEKKRENESRVSAFSAVAQDSTPFRVRHFLDDLVSQGFGGVALTLAANALFHMRFCSEEYRVVPHPVNQSGSSSRQFSDLDVYLHNSPFMGAELKDKPFTESDVERAAATAHGAGARSLLFVAGRQSTFAAQPPTYFARAREKYAAMGLYVGVTSIDSLIDTTFACNIDFDAREILEETRAAAERIGAIEAQMWIYERLATDIQ